MLIPNMAGPTTASTFVCSCFFTNNIFVKKYKLHVSYQDRSQFFDNYSKILRNKGCVTDKQFEEVIKEVECEVARRRQLGDVSLARREVIRQQYEPLHEEVYHLQEDYLAPEFLSLVSTAKSSSASLDLLLQKLDTLDDGVYTFPVFTQRFCGLLLEELENIEQSICPKGRPNTMNQFGVLLNEFNFNKGLLDPLRCHYLNPITALFYPTWGGGCLDSHKAFTVTYEIDHDLDLSCHYDNAEVTLNVALGHIFTGGNLYFLGMSSEVDSVESKTPTKCVHRPGWGVLHPGQRMHGAEPLQSGKRCNLILWMRSSSVRNTQCPMCRDVPDLVHVSGLDDGFRVLLEAQPAPEPGPRVVDVCQTL